jgi:hypothetical protein
MPYDSITADTQSFWGFDRLRRFINSSNKRYESILLIEDDEQNRYLETFLLEARGFDVEVTSDGPFGIKMAAEGRNDLILPNMQVMSSMMALQLNELITNAIKHAFPGRRRGLIKAPMRRIDEGALYLSVGNAGGTEICLKFRRHGGR